MFVGANFAAMGINTMSNGKIRKAQVNWARSTWRRIFGTKASLSKFCVAILTRKSDQVLLVAKEININGLSQKECDNALNEVRVLSVLVHPNIIRCYESFIDRMSLVIIMEYADGLSRGWAHC